MWQTLIHFAPESDRSARSKKRQHKTKNLLQLFYSNFVHGKGIFLNINFI
jgi:hypothetical protein